VTPLEWLTLLYADAPPGLWLVLNTKRDAGNRTQDDPFRCLWFQVSDLANAATAATTAGGASNVYHGLGLREQRLSDTQRGCAGDVSCIPGLWLDLDVAGGTHEDSPREYFPTKETAYEFVTQMLPHAPSVVIDSGGGLQAHWLFREPWVFDGPDDREHAAALLRGWQSFIRSRTSHAIDSTHDLARVLRMPGTYNRKNGSVRPVKVMSTDGPVYSPSEFDEWIDLDSEDTKTDPVDVRDKPPNYDMVSALMEDTRFKQTVDMKRKDLKDQTTSSYCMSLTCQLVCLGWSDQDITDFLVWWRKSHCTPYKEKTAGWYRITINKARRMPVIKEQGDRAKQLVRASSATEPEERLAALSEYLGFKVNSITRWRAVDEESGITGRPWFVIDTGLGIVKAEGGQLAERKRFMNEICFEQLGRSVEIPTKLWPDVKQVIAQSWTTEDASKEYSEYEDLRQSVREYADKKTVTEDPLQARDSNQVLSRDGNRWVSITRLCDWLRMKKGIHLGPRNASRDLQLAGCRRIEIKNVRHGQGMTSLVFWSVP